MKDTIIGNSYNTPLSCGELVPNIGLARTEEKELKTHEVAHDADMDVENLRKYIKGEQEMKVSTMLKIANALNVKVEELFVSKRK